MVKIISSKISQNSEGKSFVSLKLQGEVEAVQSMQSGRMYLTTRTCYISTTFDETTANALIGKELPGTIERVPSEAYEYKIEGTGEVITLSHRYEYRPLQLPTQSSENVSDNDLEQFEELAA